MTTTKIFKITIGICFYEDNEVRIAKKEFFLIEEKKEDAEKKAREVAIHLKESLSTDTEVRFKTIEMPQVLPNTLDDFRIYEECEIGFEEVYCDIMGYDDEV